MVSIKFLSQFSSTFSSTFSNAFCVLILLSLVSCGDLFMKKEDSKETTTEQFSQCELDTQALSTIFSKNIEIELLCLEQNLNLFIDVVKTDRPGYLSLKELKLYIEKHISDIDPAIVEALDIVFETNSLIFGDHKEYIARENVAKLIELLIEVNQVVVENDIVNLFTSKAQVNFKEHNQRKSKVFMTFSYISSKLKQAQVVKDNFSSLNLKKLFEVLRTQDNAAKLDKVKSLLFLKKIFLGGDNEVLTSREFQKLIDMLADGGKIAFDMTQFANIQIEDNEYEEIILTLKEDFEAVVRSLNFDRESDVTIMLLSDLMGAIKAFLPEFDKYTKYNDQILKFKEILLENSRPEFSANEVYLLLENLILENLKRSAFFYRTFRLNEEVLTSGEVIQKDLEEFFFLDASERQFKDDFNQVVKSYRFLRGKELIATYSSEVKRNAVKMLEIAVLENITKKIMTYYGVQDPRANGGLKLSFDQLVVFMKDLQPILEGEGFSEPNRIEAAAETIFLMASLFQSHSDGDLEIELNELVQFLLTILGSYEVQDVMLKEIQKVCKLDTKGRYSPDCFRDNFINLMELNTKQGSKLTDHFPKMMKFLRGLSAEKQREYIIGAESISRACMTYQDKEVPMLPSDIFFVFSGLSNIEQTMIRFDLNNDNILGPKELDRTYEVYEEAIKALIPGKFMKRFAKSVFLYLVRYKKVPDVGDVKGWRGFWRATKAGAHFFKFLMTPKKYTPADRQTLLSIIQTLQSYSDSEPYPCHLLMK